MREDIRIKKHRAKTTYLTDVTNVIIYADLIKQFKHIHSIFETATERSFNLLGSKKNGDSSPIEFMCLQIMFLV